MKKLLFILLCLPLIGLGQDLNRLDEKAGFRDFKIGDSFSKWESELGLPDKNNRYVYLGNCCKELFGYPIKLIILRFEGEENSILVEINILTENFQNEECIWRDNDFEIINGMLIKLFGRPTASNPKLGGGSMGWQWHGKKIGLTSIYEFLGTRIGDRQLIVITSKEFSDKILDDEF
tara:strand:+ start:63 stop:593 length:531 start_codon:yes stop_codon:yes gene_type:complete